MRIALQRSVLVFVAIVACAGLSARAGEVTNTVWIDEPDVRLSEGGWQTTQSKRSVGGNPLRLRGKTYERGIGTHSPGAFSIDLSGNSKRFLAVAGIDDETNGGGRAEFRVLGDGKLLWTSGIVTGGDPPKNVDLDVTGLKRLELIVTTAGDGYGFDHTDWADARLEVTGAAPKAAAPPEPTLFETMSRDLAEIRGQYVHAPRDAAVPVENPAGRRRLESAQLPTARTAGARSALRGVS